MGRRTDKILVRSLVPPKVQCGRDMLESVVRVLEAQGNGTSFGSSAAERPGQVDRWTVPNSQLPILGTSGKENGEEKR